MKNTVRTRFAPSPTGYLHIGGARTALYNYLFARHHQGVFLLRIEDTDRERSTKEAVDVILEAMAWLELDYDEGPFYQTQRFDRYLEVANRMLESGTAYRCNCSQERLEKVREQQMQQKLKPKYDGCCREKELAKDCGPHVIRFKNPLTGQTIVNDVVHGQVVFENTELDDLVLIRSDGTPTYNFTVVVDDLDMQITHVIRGDDHLNNTPKQINILKALGAELPQYAHIPMILGPDGKKLSKRHGAASVMSYRDEGFLPVAINNYLARLGWSHGDQEIFDKAELIKYFDLSSLNHSASAINPDKLLWLNQHYMKSLSPEIVETYLTWHLNDQAISTETGPELHKIITIQADRAKTLAEMASKSRYFYTEELEYTQELIDKFVTPEIASGLHVLFSELNFVDEWTREHIHQKLHDVCEKTGLKLGKLGQPIRIAVTGDTSSPSIDITLELLGKAKTLTRLKNFLAKLA